MTLPADPLFNDIRALIDQARERAYTAVNAELVWLYWQIGRTLVRHFEAHPSHDGGEQSLRALSRRLTLEYGSGYSKSNLGYFVQLVRLFPDEQLVHALRGQLSWTHFRTLLGIEDELKRAFYLEMCRLERWSTRRLRDKIDGMLYERTAISRKPETVIEQELDTLATTGELSTDLVFRDPYVLDFLGLRDTFSERDVESAIVADLQRFLIELGSDFAFIARQKRLPIDDVDYYLDLLFYHRRLRRLVAIDLKLGAFKPGDKGQMELYLRWLDRYERQPGEEEPIGLILCAEKAREHIELLMLDEGNIRVAQYLTELPPREVLEARLHQAILDARARALPPKSPNDR